jgi:hypothetical protein
MAECVVSAHPLRNGDEWLFKLRLNSRPSNLRNKEKENLAYFGFTFIIAAVTRRRQPGPGLKKAEKKLNKRWGM